MLMGVWAKCLYPRAASAQHHYAKKSFRCSWALRGLRAETGYARSTDEGEPGEPWAVGGVLVPVDYPLLRYCGRWSVRPVGFGAVGHASLARA